MNDADRPPPPRPAAPAVVRFDAAVDRVFARLRGRTVPDRLFYTASALGEHSVVWHVLAAVRCLRRGGDVRDAARLVTLMGIESLVVNGVVKSVFRRSRPISNEPRPHRIRQPRTSSFPSGHSSAAAAFTVVAGEGDRLAPAYLALAVTVAASRVHVRMHHASDVVGGVVLGTALGWVLRRAWPAGRRGPRAR